MIYTPLTRKAMKIAYDAHQGQMDCSGVPYIFHPYEVAEQLDTETRVCAALLHDVVEDTEVTLEQLSTEFPAEIIEILKLLTHDPKEDYFDYIRRIKANSDAVAVKLADIAHNSDESRQEGVETITDEKKLHWREKYRLARKILEEE